MSEPTPSSAATTYRLDRRFVLGSVGVQVVGAGLAAMLAFFVWEWIGLLAVALLLNAVRLALLPPAVVRADAQGARLGGPLTGKPVRLAWSEVDDVSLDGGQLVFSRSDESTVVFSLAHLGERGAEFVRDVYDRLNATNGYRRFDPTA
ncbi:MAG: hypothetical protein ABWY58_04080 [Aeromicrobium sp.]